MRASNLTLLTDLYELTMMQGYFKNPTNQTVIFDMFYRTNPCGGSFAITAGLEQMIEYIENLHFSEEDIEYLRGLHIFQEDFLDYLSTFRFTGDIYAIPEGTVVFPREPIVKVIAPIMESLLRSPGRRRYGIWFKKSPGSRRRHLRRESRCDRRMCGNLQRACRTDV